MKEATGSFAPALFLLSDGAPTDDYSQCLEDLRKNSWFKQAIKVAVAIGDNANKTILAEFTGDAEAVLEVHNAKMLKKMIKFVSVRVSQVASKSTQAENLFSPSQPSVSPTVKQQELNSQIADLVLESLESKVHEEEW
jgi:uncharacterized protein YegL